MTQSAANGAERSRKRGTVGCLLALAVFLVVATLFGVLLQRRAEQEREASERERAESLAESVRQVRAGDDGSGILVFHDGQLIKMLASDPDCIANLKILQISMTDLEGSDVASASKLTSVERITFYDCYGAERLLAAMKGSRSVEELSFDTTLLSDEGVKLLASFPNLKRVHFAYIREPSKAKSLREALPGVKVEVEEVGEGLEP